MSLRFWTAVALGIALITARSARVEACSCEQPGPPCAELFTSTVFVGKAIKVVKDAGSLLTTFAVSEVLNGKVDKTTVVRSVADGYSCGFAFKIGTRYVVYAGGSGASLSLGRCSRTRTLARGKEDLEFARSARKQGDAVVEGTVSLYENSTAAPHPGVEVRVRGTNVSARSGPDGAFRLVVAPGTYVLDIVSNDVYPWGARVTAITVPAPAACAHPRLIVVWDGRIDGTLSDSGGKPAAGVVVAAVSTTAPGSHSRLEAVTDASGHFAIHAVPAGTFRVGVSVPENGGVVPTSPYPTTYFPGTTVAAKATTITVARAKVTANISFAVAAPRAVHRVKVSVRRAGGAPAARAAVDIKIPTTNRSIAGVTDAQGDLDLDEFEGEEIVLKSCWYGPGKPECVESKHRVAGPLAIELRLPR